MIDLNGKQISARIKQVYSRDSLNFCNTTFFDCCYVDGAPLTDEEVKELHEKYGDVLSKMAFDSSH